MRSVPSVLCWWGTATSTTEASAWRAQATATALMFPRDALAMLVSAALSRCLQIVLTTVEAAPQTLVR